MTPVGKAIPASGSCRPVRAVAFRAVTGSAVRPDSSIPGQGPDKHAACPAFARFQLPARYSITRSMPVTMWYMLWQWKTQRPGLSE